MLKVSGLCVLCRVLRSASRKILGADCHISPPSIVLVSVAPLCVGVDRRSPCGVCSSSSLPSTAKTDRRKPEHRARGTLCFTFKSLHYA